MGDERVARRVRVTGRVQAVGFRASTSDRAQQAGLAGWVRNEPDGSVEVHVEGDPESVDDLVAWLHDGPRHADVDDVTTEQVEPSGTTGFEVRH